MIRPEDKGAVIAVATQILCARLQSRDAYRENGESKHGYTPDIHLCVGEACALINAINLHLPPQFRPAPVEDRRKNHHGKTTRAVEITFRAGEQQG